MFSVQAIDLESNQLQCVQAIWTFIDSIEKIATEQYDRTAAIASEQVCACVCVCTPVQARGFGLSLCASVTL